MQIPPFAPMLLLTCAVGCEAFNDVGDVTDQESPTAGEPGVSSPSSADSGVDTPPDEGGGTEALNVTMVTSPVGGEYAPNNIVAAWIEDPGGTYQATIGRWSEVRTAHLVAWNQASGGDTDVVSGATRLGHGDPIVATWSIPTELADGTYTIRIEIADGNSNTPDLNHQATFSFERNGEATQQDLSGQGLESITIDYSGR